MIHWAWLIPTFVLGALACYGFLYWVAKSAGAFGDWLFGEKERK